jgi:hypothetical protein
LAFTVEDIEYFVPPLIYANLTWLVIRQVHLLNWSLFGKTSLDDLAWLQIIYHLKGSLVLL